MMSKTYSSLTVNELQITLYKKTDQYKNQSPKSRNKPKSLYPRTHRDLNWVSSYPNKPFETKNKLQANNVRLSDCDIKSSY